MSDHDHLKEVIEKAIESLDVFSPIIPYVYPYRPWFPSEVAMLRTAVTAGWLPAEDYPEIWSRCPWEAPNRNGEAER